MVNGDSFADGRSFSSGCVLKQLKSFLFAVPC